MVDTLELVVATETVIVNLRWLICMILHGVSCLLVD